MAHTGWKILNPCPPVALLLTQLELEHTTLHKEVMGEPVLRPGLAVPRGTLDVDGLVVRIEVLVADSGHAAGDAVAEADFFEERSADEVDILAGNRPKSHHCQNSKRAHRSAVVVTREAGDAGIESRWDVVVRALG